MKDWNGMLDELLYDESDTLNEWEIGFLESMDEVRGRKGTPTGPMIKKLSQIWDKVFN